MDREIIFRGKTNSGNWAYGSLLTDIDDALNYARKQKDYFNTLLIAASKATREERFEEENKSLKRKLELAERELKQCKGLNVRLTGVLASVNNIEICKHCGGDGGFDAGEDSCECPVCGGSGYVKIEVKN
jgi:DnaJ-class molecular chaperone